MKISKNMYYQKSQEARELYLISENNAENYDLLKPIYNCIEKHIKKGQFNAEKAIQGIYNKLYYVSKNYSRDFGYMFTTTERYTTSFDLLEGFLIDEYPTIYDALDRSPNYFMLKYRYGKNVTSGGACSD